MAGSSAAAAAAAQVHLHGNLRFLLACASSLLRCLPLTTLPHRSKPRMQRGDVHLPTFLGLRAAAAVAGGGRAEVCLGLRFGGQICDGRVVGGQRVLQTPVSIWAQRQSCRTQTHTVTEEQDAEAEEEEEEEEEF